MIRSGMLCRIITVLAVILEISAVQHWHLTANGKIEAKNDSVFNMRRPDDLVAFLEQEKRRDTANAIQEKISKKEVSIDNQFIALGMTDMENSNSDCFSGKSLVDVDVHANIVIDPYKLRDGIDQSDYMLYNVAASGKQTAPDCQGTFSLNFSIYTFEHLKAMQIRKNLTQHEELSLMNYLPPNTDLDQFGHQLAYSLSRNSTSWIYLNLASIYWRIKGNAYNALECSRRAIVCASRQYRDIPLLTTAGILHAAKYSGEAAIILHAAIDQNPTESYHHLALGHVYASLGDYDRAAACYNNCLKLAPDTIEAKHMKYAISCHRLLETTLSLFDERLQNVLSDIHMYHDWKEKWFKLYEDMLREQDIKPSMREIKLAFARENLHTFTMDYIEKLIQNIDNNVMLNVGDRKSVAKNMLQNVHVSLNMFEDLEKQLKNLNHITQDIMDKLEYNYLSTLSKRSKYQNIEIKKRNRDFEAKDWPKISDCHGPMLTFDDEKRYLPVYLPLENKGYATHFIRKFVNELIDVEPGESHPWPWHLPICQKPKSYNDKYITHALLDATVQLCTSDASLKPFLLDLAQVTNFAEIGQRILRATERKVAASWVLSMLASLYLRVVGKPRLALDCLQLALDDAPREFRDVPLVSIASMHHKVDLIDDALKITNEALQINAAEPETNFLFGILLNVKGNYTGAMYYFKQTLKVNPHLYDGRALMFLRILACREKFNVFAGNEAGCDRQEISLHRYSVSLYLSSVLLARYNLQASDILTRKRQVKNFKRFKCTSIKTEEIEVHYWNSYKLPDSLCHDTKEHKIKQYIYQDLRHSMLLPNSLTKLYEPYVRINRTDYNVLYVHWTFDKIFDDQKSNYPSKDECDELKYKDWAAFLFMFRKFRQFRNMTIENQMQSLDDDIPILQPTCDRITSNWVQTTQIRRFTETLQHKTENDMIEWLMMITGIYNETLEELGSKIAFALKKDYSSWTLPIAASYYWRATGDSKKALNCIWQGIENVPPDMEDILFINLASLLSSQNYLHSALQIAHIALSINQHFIVNHYMLANLYAVMGDLKSAVSYYRSSLDIDPDFEPATTRLRVIQCLLLFDDKKTAMSEILWNVS